MTTDTRTTLRLPEGLRDRLFDMAERNRRSIHAQILIYIEQGLDQDEKKINDGN
jgi:hypothetical protein